jgi:hypothetical protein
MWLLTILLMLAGGPVLKIKVAPIQGFEPATVVIETSIEPKEGNNVACLVIDSESYYSSSCWELAGAEDRSIHRRTFKDLPGGEYIAVLNVDHGGEVKSTSREFKVLSKSQ